MASNNFILPSLPALAAGLDNAEVIDAKFVYNFFTTDERINERFSTFPEDGVTDQAYYTSRIRKLPRYVKIDFTAPQPSNSSLGLPSLKQRLEAGEKIVYENSPFNANFSAVEIADTLVDSRSYEIASASLNFEEVVEESQLQTGAPAPENVINPKALIFNSLGNIQSAGYSYARTDVREEIKSQFLRDVRGFWTSISLNNLFISDVIDQVITDQRSIFADEFASVVDSASTIQDKSRQAATPLKVFSDYYDHNIPTPNVKILDASTFETLPPTEYKLVGFIAQKFSQQADGSLKIYDDLVFSETGTSIIDPGVRYGGVYSYQVRAVYNIRTYVAAQDQNGRGVGIAQVDMLFATVGSNVDVDCTEKVPPRPPEDLYFKFENDGTLFIGWRFPLNPQRDIKKFQVFRRRSIEDPFEIIAELDFDDSFEPFVSTENIPKTLIYKKRYPATFFIDKHFNVNSKFIYAVVAIDAHGLSSNYSSQLEVSVNLLTEVLNVKPVCRPGAPKPYPNLMLLSDFFPDLIKDSGHTKMTVFFNPSYTDLTDERGNKLNVISYNPVSPTYKIQILQTNLAQAQVININLTNDKIVREIPASEGKIYTQIV